MAALGLRVGSRRQRRHHGHLHRELALPSRCRCPAATPGAGVAPLHGNLALVAGGQQARCGHAAGLNGSNFAARSDHARQRQGSGAQAPEWDFDRYGLPISQSAMLLTLLGGSVAPALGLTALGYLTSRREMRAVLHFNRYCGHLVGVRCDNYFPETVLDAWRILFMADSGSQL